MSGNVVIIGAGPAGLTAALELVRAGIKPIVVEADKQVGGISKTVNHHGNRMDLGGHRFFSKSNWVMQWWQEILPLDPEANAAAEAGAVIAYQNQRRELLSVHSAEQPDSVAVMLLRPRLSRIYYLRKFFDYPVKLNANTALNLGLVRVARIGLSYFAAQMAPRKPERSLEDFLVNRFGDRLYRTFFKDYTEKVWGVPCERISAEWGAQRIKGLSISKALLHAARQLVRVRRDTSTSQSATETSLIEQFMYPRFGPGQLWEEVERQVRAQGGQVLLRHTAEAVIGDGSRVKEVRVRNLDTREALSLPASSVISTMCIKDLIEGLVPAAPVEVREVAGNLPYRDFITVGLLVSRMFAPKGSVRTSENGVPSDNWIYVQEPEVRLGRLQIFNNWSPAMVAAHPKAWIGLEYFCNEGDELWSKSDEEFIRFAARELEIIGLIKVDDVEDSTIVRVPKAYPAYFGAYAKLDVVKSYVSRYENLYLVGRNGMHRYNNQDHSMLASKHAVDCILGRRNDKEAIWDINAEQEYHEEKGAS